MRQTVKLITGAFVAVLMIGAITLLAIKYFDVLMRIFENVKSQLTSKRPRFVTDACCGSYDEDEFDDEMPEEV